MRDSCDILVVGGGPAGLIAAREAASSNRGLEVVVVERDRAIGAPVRCGEGVGAAGLSEFVDVSPAAQWISRTITSVVLRAPDGTDVSLSGGAVAYVLDRTRFEPVLAAQASAAGSEILLNTEALGMQRAGEKWLVALDGPDGARSIRARVVIGADGVESMVGRWAGLDTRVPSRDMESCAQYVLHGLVFDPNAIVLHFGRLVAPSGYAWVFPKGTDRANVGLGVIGLRAGGRPARAWLDHYVDAQFPGAVRTGCTVGGVIVHTTVKQTVADGLMLCGDAAHMVNPLSGGGIINAMKAGRLAARTAVDALKHGDTSAARLERYHRAWMTLLGDDHVRFYRIKEALNRFEDPFYNDLARTARRLPTDKRTLGRVFAHALAHHPGLLPVVARYFA